MMLTEAEAARKRCPMSMASQSAQLYCIGSACMAWRVGEAAYPGDVLKVGADGMKYYLFGTERPAKGYCGLAR